MNDKLKVVMVQPQKESQVVEIGSQLKDLQEAVGGFIEVVYPFEDEVGLLLNEEGKLIGMQPNRALKDEDGEIYDIIFGTFYVVGLSEDNFCSLTEEQIEKYLKEYEQPYSYVRMGKGIIEVPIHRILPDNTRNPEAVIKGKTIDFGAL